MYRAGSPIEIYRLANQYAVALVYKIPCGNTSFAVDGGTALSMSSRPPGEPNIVHLDAAGGVVFRPGAQGQFEVAICGRTRGSLWALPKGKPNGAEPPFQTALREVREETGLEVEGGPLVGEVRYTFHRPEDGGICHKVVRFYLMKAVGGDISEHDAEFDEVVWLPTDEALRRLTYENEARILEKAVALAKDSATGQP